MQQIPACIWPDFQGFVFILTTYMLLLPTLFCFTKEQTGAQRGSVTRHGHTAGHDKDMNPG
jgi:hypothetical protein